MVKICSTVLVHIVLIDVKNLFKVFYFFLKMWFFKVFYFF